MRAILLSLLIFWPAAFAAASAARSEHADTPIAPNRAAQETDTMAQVHHAQPAPYTHTLRVTFAYDGEKLHVISVQRVNMRAPAPVTPPPQEGQTGYWIELRDAQGTLLYHRPLHEPVRQDIEVFGDKPGDPIRRVPARHPKGEFEVLIPDMSQGAEFVLHGPPTGKPMSQSTVLARHGMSELHRMAAAGSGGNQPGTQGRTP